MSATQTNGMSNFDVKTVTAHRTRQKVRPLWRLNRHCCGKGFNTTVTQKDNVKIQNEQKQTTFSPVSLVVFVDFRNVKRGMYDHCNR